ncbi:gluconate 2-dehydrogenase subunit 3 family protein [Salinarimonas soli]|nr:gluconate 2-dehydrogenase subunit 3 family protein [Salinarimonas soli]
MNAPDGPPTQTSRRNFLIAGVAATALVGEAATPAAAQTPTAAAVPDKAPPAGPGPAGSPAPLGPQGYRFLSGAEVETLTAMVDRLIPADETGPGGVESGVLTFIDRELGGQFGAAARWYMAGPWAEGTRSQGWQLALTPAQVYRTGFLALDRWCVGTRGKRFAELSPPAQDEVLTLMQGGKIDLAGLSSAVFFDLLWQNVVEGYLSDPLYGGNRGMEAWRMIGFKGANPVLTDAVDLNGELYQLDPIAIGA